MSILTLFFLVCRASHDDLARSLGYVSLGHGRYFDHPDLRGNVTESFQIAEDGLIPTRYSHCTTIINPPRSCLFPGYVLFDGIDEDRFYTSRPLDRPQRDIFLISTFNAQRPALIHHFVHYYKQMGVHEDNFLILLNADSEQSAGLSGTKHVLHSLNIQFVTWIAPFSDINHYHHLHMLVKTRKKDFVVWTDADEFHDFEGKNVDDMADEMEKHKFTHVCGRLVDRVSSLGDFPAIQDIRRQSIFDQFPLRCKLTEKVVRANPNKVLFARGDQRPTLGHHMMRDMSYFKDRKMLRYLPNSYTGEINQHHKEMETMHFKWTMGCVAYLAERVKSFREQKYAHWWESQAFVDVIESEGHIDTKKHCD